MNEKMVKMFIHCLKERHILFNFQDKTKVNSAKDIIKLIMNYRNINQKPYQITSHIFTWDYSYRLDYCIVHYKLCYFIHRIFNIDIDEQILINLSDRTYTAAIFDELDDYAKYFKELRSISKYDNYE